MSFVDISFVFVLFGTFWRFLTLFGPLRKRITGQEGALWRGPTGQEDGRAAASMQRTRPSDSAKNTGRKNGTIVC
jgi:hypothetical protein